MTKSVNLISPIPELKKRTIFIHPGYIEILMEDFIIKSRNKRTPEMAILWAEGFRDAYKAAGVFLRIETKNELGIVVSSPAKFSPKSISYADQRKYSIKKLGVLMNEGSDESQPLEIPWLLIINLDASSYGRRFSSREETLSYVDGFRCGYREFGISIMESERNFAFK